MSRSVGPLYAVPCQRCAAGIAEFYGSRGRPLVLTRAGVRHVGIVVRHTVRARWIYEVNREARRLRDLLAASHRADGSPRSRPSASIITVYPPACEQCATATATSGGGPLVVLTPGHSLDLAHILTRATYCYTVPAKVAASVRVLRAGGFDPLPFEVLGPLDPRWDATWEADA